MSTFDILLFVGVVAAVSGVSPTLLSIFTSLLAGTRGKGHDNKKVWINGLSFFAGFIATVTVIGFVFWVLLSKLDSEIAKYVSIGVVVLAIVAAIIEIKDYFWYGRGISHKPHKQLATSIHTRTTKKFGALNSFMLGIVSIAATASNIGLVTVAVACLLNVTGLTPSVEWFVFLGICLVFGSFFTLFAVAGGTKIGAILQWKEESKAVMRLGSGLALLALAWLILLLISHTLVLGGTQ